MAQSANGDDYLWVGTLEYGALNQGQYGQKLIYKTYEKRMLVKGVKGNDYALESGEYTVLLLDNFSQMRKTDIQPGDTLKMLRYNY